MDSSRLLLFILFIIFILYYSNNYIIRPVNKIYVQPQPYPQPRPRKIYRYPTFHGGHRGRGGHGGRGHGRHPNRHHNVMPPAIPF